MNINGVNGGMNGMNRISAASKASEVKNNSVPENGAKSVADDKMELSGRNGAEAVGTLNLDPNEVRMDLVNRVRAEIAAGTYYSDAKFEAAMNRMLDSFLG